MMVMMIIPANRGDRDRAASRDDDNGGDDDGDDAANCDGDDDHGGHLCRIASHVGTGSKNGPDAIEIGCLRCPR